MMELEWVQPQDTILCPEERNNVNDHYNQDFCSMKDTESLNLPLRSFSVWRQQAAKKKHQKAFAQ